MTPPFRIVKLIIAHFEIEYRHERVKMMEKQVLIRFIFEETTIDDGNANVFPGVELDTETNDSIYEIVQDGLNNPQTYVELLQKVVKHNVKRFEKRIEPILAEDLNIYDVSIVDVQILDNYGFGVTYRSKVDEHETGERFAFWSDAIEVQIPCKFLDDRLTGDDIIMHLTDVMLEVTFQ